MTSKKRILQGSGLDDQTENEFYRKFNIEFNGLKGTKLDCHFVRRKDLKQLHLIIIEEFKVLFEWEEEREEEVVAV